MSKRIYRSSTFFEHQVAPLSRRQLLSQTSLGFGSIALSHLLAQDGFSEEAPTEERPVVPLPHTPGTAKCVIFLFMQGGPSHLETFDPKPVLRRMDGKDLPESFKNVDLAQINTANGNLMGPLFPFHKHGESGLEISDRFPILAHHADDLAVIRSCYHETFIHGPAVTIMSRINCLITGGLLEPAGQSAQLQYTPKVVKKSNERTASLLPRSAELTAANPSATNSGTSAATNRAVRSSMP